MLSFIQRLIGKKIMVIALCIGIMSFMKADDPEAQQAAMAKKANRFMWDNLHKGNYDSIPSILAKLNAAYTTDSKNATVTAHLGFVYLWSFSERVRGTPDSSIIENIYLSNRFFKEATKLNPDDARLFGFQSATEICQGALSKNFMLIIRGYLKGLNSIKKWPQFNKFALSLIESQRDTSSLMYKQAMTYQWQLIDDCSCKELTEEKIMADPKKVLKELVDELKSSSDAKIKRVCWNTWIAPHNMEGYFLNFGDMLVKEGKLTEAKEMYAAAKLCPTYNQWPYKKLLESRIKDIEINYVEFNKPLQLLEFTSKKQIFINSEISCVGCHQMSKSEYKKSKIHEPPL